MKIRRYQPDEASERWDLYVNTTHRVVARTYTQAQVDRWAPAQVEMKAWSQKLADTNPFVAVEKGRIVALPN